MIKVERLYDMLPSFGLDVILGRSLAFPTNLNKIQGSAPNPLNIESLIREARSAEATGQIGRAVWLSNKALFQEPNCVDALLILGSLAARQGRVEEAAALLRRATSADPGSYDAARWLTTLLIGRDGGQEAVKFGKQAVRIRPNDVEPYIVLGLAALGAGDGSFAIECLERAVEIDPNISGAHHNLGVALQREESFEEAIVSFENAIALSPIFESYLHLGRCYLAAARPEDALECARNAANLNPQSRMAKALIADANYAAALGDRGLEHIQAAVNQDPREAFPHAMLGSRLQEMGAFEEAAKSIQTSIELQPNQGFAYYLFAHNRKLGNEDRAVVDQMEGVARTASLVKEDEQYLHFALGKAHDDLGDYENAMKHFDLAHGEKGEPELAVRTEIEAQAKRAARFKEIFSPDFLERYADLGLESHEPIFIVGMPRSGTTLLEQIVSRHSTVGGAGELFFWRDNIRRIIHLGRGEINARQANIAGAKYLDFIRSRAPGMAHVTDKFPSNYMYLGLLRLIYPNAVFIHARRNPLDTCLSMYMRPFVTQQGLGRGRRQIVDAYKAYRQTMQHWRELLEPNRLMEVDYEQLVQDPEPMTRRLIEFCGLPWEDACLRPEEGDRRVVTFSMWQVRQPVYTTSVERWRRYEPWLGIFKELQDLPSV